MNKYNDKIDHFLANYSFEELSEEAKALVRTEMSTAEYTQMREVLSVTSSLNNTTIPPLAKNIKQNLRQNLRQRHAGPATTYTMRWAPLVFGMLIGIMGASLWFWQFPTNNKIDTNTSPSLAPVIADTVFVHNRDTLYVTIESEPKIITTEVIKYIEKEAKNTSSPNTNSDIALNTKSAAGLQPSATNNYSNNLEVTEIIPMKIGASISEEKELMDLLFEMPSDDFHSRIQRK